MTPHQPALQADGEDAVTQIVVASASLQATAQRVAELACTATGAAAARVTVVDSRGGPSTVAATGELSSDAARIPLQAGDREVGALELTATDDDTRGFAERAAVVLLNARDYWAVRELADGLQAALDSRAVIDMAKGKLMARGGVTPDDAFALLVKASQRENVKLREIAQRIVYGDLNAAGPPDFGTDRA